MLRHRHTRLGLVALSGALLIALGALAGPSVATTASAADTWPVRVEPDLSYGTGTPQQVLDLYQPVGATGRPIVLLVHGGGWRAGDKSTFTPAARMLATRGFVVANVNYTLGAASVPAYRRQTEDVRAAVSWVRAHAARYGGDPERLALVGGSAGGYLVAMVATSINSPADAPVKAAVSLSGPMDIPALVADLREQQTRPCAGAACALLTSAIADLSTLLGCPPLACDPALLTEASPVTHVDATAPPFYLANSTREMIPVAQAREMAAALRAQGVEAQLDVVPGDEHSMQYAGLVAGDVMRFLQDKLSSQRPAQPVATPTTEEPTAPDPPVRRGLAALLVVVVAAVLGAGAFGLRRVRHRVLGR